MMLWNCCIRYANKFYRLSSGHWKTGKSQFSFQSQRRAMPKNAQTTVQLHSLHMASKITLKILQARLQQYGNWELPDVHAGFKESEETEQIANIHWIIEKAREFQKKSTSASFTTLKPLTVWITTNCGKFFKRWEYKTTWSVSCEICKQVKKQ